MELKGFQRSFLQKKAHSLKPVVNIGKNGLTANVIQAVNEALEIHELIKVKFIDFKKQRTEIAAELAQKSKCSLVKLIGNTAIFYKAKENQEERKFHLPGSYGEGSN